jgi:hypothetical protein
MAKETKETFSGKLKDQAFEMFDEKVLTWCRKLFGDYYAKGLWHNDLQELGYLDLNEDEDSFTFEMQCARVYNVLAIKSPKEADHLFQSDRFWTKKWQLEFRQRCRERIFCQLEKASSGEAARQVRKLGFRMMDTMRDYLLGMPHPHGNPFPSRVNIEIKLDELEEEREYLLKMCPADMRDSYGDEKEETLVRILVSICPKNMTKP